MMWLVALVALAVALPQTDNPCVTTVCDDSTCVTRPLCEQVFFLASFDVRAFRLTG
jgi:hypothetical protein